MKMIKNMFWILTFIYPNFNAYAPFYEHNTTNYIINAAIKRGVNMIRATNIYAWHFSACTPMFWSMQRFASDNQNFPTRAQKDWITFFKNAHNMTEEDVKKQIQTPEVLLAFEKIKIDNLPEVRKAYEAQDMECKRYADHTQSLVNKGKTEGVEEGMKKGRAEGKAEGRIEGKAKVVRNMLKKSVNIETISEFTELSIPEIEKLSTEHKKHGRK